MTCNEKHLCNCGTSTHTPHEVGEGGDAPEGWLGWPQYTSPPTKEATLSGRWETKPYRTIRYTISGVTESTTVGVGPEHTARQIHCQTKRKEE